MTVFIIKKIFLLIVMLFLLSIIVFYISHLSPGDPLQSFYGDAMQSMSVHEIALARTRLGLDRPIFYQYQQWMAHIFHGDLGISLKYKRPVIEIILPLMKNTLILGCSAYLLIFLFAIFFALLCAHFEGSFFDRWIGHIGTTIYYLPTFWVAMILVLVFSVNLHWLPSSGAYSFGKSADILDRAKHMVLPLVVMVGSHVWYYAAMIRNRLLDEKNQDYVLLARAKGLTPFRALFYHCFRNVLPTLISIMAISISHVVSGTYIIEAVFNYQGLGAIAVSSAKYHDYNVLMIIILITGVLIIGAGLIAQSINELIDVRIRAEKTVIL